MGFWAVRRSGAVDPAAPVRRYRAPVPTASTQSTAPPIFCQPAAAADGFVRQPGSFGARGRAVRQMPPCPGIEMAGTKPGHDDWVAAVRYQTASWLLSPGLLRGDARAGGDVDVLGVAQHQ